MHLIANRDRREKVAFNTEILAEIETQIKQYCKLTGVLDLGFFIEEAAKLVFANDTLWQKHLIEKKNETSKI